MWKSVITLSLEMLLHVSVTASRQFLPISLCVSSMWHQRKTWGNYAILSLASQSQNSWIKRKKKRTSINGMWRFVPTLKYCDISLIGNTCRSQRLPEQKWVKMCFNETGFVTFDCSFIFFQSFSLSFFPAHLSLAHNTAEHWSWPPVVGDYRKAAHFLACLNWMRTGLKLGFSGCWVK